MLFRLSHPTPSSSVQNTRLALQPLGKGSGLLALGSGCLMALAVPPVSLWGLAWVALVPLWILVRKAVSPGVAGVYGLLWGAGFYGTTLFWITHLHPLTWMGLPWLGSLSIALVAWLIVTAWGTIGTALWAASFRWLWRSPLQGILWGAALWCWMEIVRSWTPLDWASLALTQSPHNGWILQLSRLSGQITVVAVIVITNGLLAEAWLQAQNSLNGTAEVRRWIGAAGAILVASHVTGLIWQAHTLPDAAHQNLSVGMIQGNVPTRIKLTPQGIQQAMTRYVDGYRTLARQGVDAVVTPEGALPMVWNPLLPQAQALADLVQQVGTPLWLGTFAPTTSHSQRLNQSLLEIREDGQVHGRYNKVKLVPLGEYLPLEPVLGKIISRLSPLDSYLVPGDANQQFLTSLGPVIVGICYESAYGEFFRYQAHQGGRFILTASNNDPYPPAMMAQHHALDVIRAIETDRWAVRVTNTGLSGVVDSQGKTRWLSSPNVVVLHAANFFARETQTPYVRFGRLGLPLGLIVGGIVISGYPFSQL